MPNAESNENADSYLTAHREFPCVGNSIARASSRFLASEDSFSDGSDPDSESQPSIRFSSTVSIYHNVSTALPGSTFSLQVPQLVLNFLQESFSGYLEVTKSRIPISWFEHVSYRQGQKDISFDWAVYCLITTHIGHRESNSQYIMVGRMFYLRSLRRLSAALQNSRLAKSDEILSAILILNTYETLSCNSLEGWKYHANGINAIMRLRGPDMHKDGLGCNLYFACRYLLVVSAFLSGTTCLLELPEWQVLNESLASQNSKNKDSSLLQDANERAFRETVKLPGLLKRLNILLSPNTIEKAETEQQFLSAVRTVLVTMRGIHTEFCVSATILGTYHSSCWRFAAHAPSFSNRSYNLALRGIKKSILLLNMFNFILLPSQRKAILTEFESTEMVAQDAQTPMSSANRYSSHFSTQWLDQDPRDYILSVHSCFLPESDNQSKESWMDRIALSMGMEGVRFSLKTRYKVTQAANMAHYVEKSHNITNGEEQPR